MSSIVLVQTNSSELEVELTATTKPRFGPNTGLLLIHPYAGLGGSMNDFVVAELHRYATLFFTAFFFLNSVILTQPF